MSLDSSVMSTIAHDLLALYEARATGELVLTSTPASSQSWRLYFYEGCLIYAGGGNHPVRRWTRALKAHDPKSYRTPIMPQDIRDPSWALDLLNSALQSDRLSEAQTKAIVRTIIQEVIYDLLEQPALETQWNAGQSVNQRLAFLSVTQVLEEVYHLHQAWHTAGLEQLRDLFDEFSPNLAPVVRSAQQLKAHVSPAIYKNISRLMQGGHTLLDIAAQVQSPLPTMMQALLPLLRIGIVTLQKIPDLEPVASAPDLSSSLIATQPKALIACVDDSPTIGQIMSGILNPLGYEVLPILNPLHGITTLLDRKPDVVFLDLVMPNTNGYELCTYLRKTSVFQHTPIIILTDYDSVMDRMRAKLAGASEFLPKPIEQEKILLVLQKYLPVTATSASYEKSQEGSHIAVA